jgi:hypothetical protein
VSWRRVTRAPRCAAPTTTPAPSRIALAKLDTAGGLCKPSHMACLVRGAQHRGPGWLSRCGQTPPRAFDLPVESDPVGDRVPVPTALSMRSYLRSAGFLPLTVRPRLPPVGTAGHHRRCELAQQRRRMGYVGDWQFARPTRSHRGYPLAGEAIAEPSSRASSWGS